MTLSECFGLVARSQQMTVDQLLQKTKRKRIVRPRQAAMLLANENGYSLEEIAEVCDVDPSTVWWGIGRARSYRRAVLRSMRVNGLDPVEFHSTRKMK